MRKLLTLLFMMLFCFSLFSQSMASSAEERLESYEKHLQMKNNSIFKNLEWKNIGPYFMGGRITDIEAYENNHDKFLIAVGSGGVWLTENNATTWRPIFDFESTTTIGDIAISQKNENLIWVGTGEANSLRSSYAGTGIFKSTDSGKTWQYMGLPESHHIGRVIIHPKDNNIVFAAVLGHLYTDNVERGVYKTADGGSTWKKILYVNPKTGAVDLAMHPENPDILFAAMWEKGRKAWNMTEAGEGSAVYKTIDGGKTWEKAVNGFPQGKDVGRIGISICKSKPNVVYAFLDNQEAKPEKKKVKNGKSGITVDMLSEMSSEAFLKIDSKKLGLFMKESNVPENFTPEMVKQMVKAGRVDPPTIARMMSNANQRLFNTNVKGAEVYRSDNDGEQWVKTHKDFIDLVYTYGYFFGQIRVNPANENTLYIMGVPTLKSVDGGKTFKDISTQGGTYGENGVHVDMHALWIDPKNPKRILLGTDGGLNISYDEGDTWQKINNLSIAQCYTIHYDNGDPYKIYTGLQDNGVNVGPHNFKFGDRVNIWKMILGGDGAFVQPEPGNPDVVYAASQFGSISRLNLKKGKHKNIQPQSPDSKSPYRFNWLSPFMVSKHNPFTLYMGANKILKTVDRGDNWFEISGDLTDKKNTRGDVPYATITAIDESSFSPEILYAGTDDGNVWVKKEIGSSWEIIGKGLPKKWVTRIVASKYKKERVYITQTGYREDDFKTYVHVSEDFGKTWKSLKANLPEEALNVIREDPDNENILYLGSDLGIYITLDRGEFWHSLKSNLPTNAVYDLRVHPREKELMIGTHGRGVYLLSVKNIGKLNGKIMKKSLHLFAIDPVILIRGPYARPQQNARILFYSSGKTKLHVEIRDRAGKKIISFDIEADTGVNVFNWDLVVDQQKKKKIAKGLYTVILKSGKFKASETLDIR